MKGINVYIVGCGGIGGYLADQLPGSIVSVMLDFVDKVRGNAAMVEYLERAGEIPMPSIVDRIVLIDGDTFNPRNAIRQLGGAGNKMRQTLDKMQSDILNLSFNQNIEIQGINDYVTPYNIQKYIPIDPPVNPWKTDEDNDLFTPAEGDFDRRPYSVIFLCVDNLKTRYEISKYAESFDNVLVINGGNKKVTGQVTVYERRNGEPLDPNLYEVYTDVTPDKDKRPDELACTTIAPQNDQIGCVNNIIACLMVLKFTRWLREGLDSYVVGKKTCRKNETIVDIKNEAMAPLYHPPCSTRKDNL